MNKKIIYFSLLVASLGSLKAQDYRTKQTISRHTGALSGSGAAEKKSGKSTDALFRNKNTSSVASVTISPCFDKGTGADGAYHATVDTTYIAGGTYNYTSFTIDAGVHVLVTGSTPLVINCTGMVAINGTLSANGGKGADGVTYTNGGIGGVGVAGGADGGIGSFSSGSGPLDGTDGLGTGGTNDHGSGWSGGGGGGYATAGDSSHGVGGFGGPNYGTANLNPVEAGSGGGGGSGGYDCGSGGGGAGGGIIKINADTIIVGAPGIVSANGGDGGSDGTGNCGGGGGGSGGSVMLGATGLTINGSVTTTGGMGGASAVSGSPYYGTGGNGSAGRIRLDYFGILMGSGTVSPAAGYTTTAGVMVTGTSPVCSGTSTLLTGNGAVTYTWSTSANTNTVTVSPTSNTTYTLTGTDSIGCVLMDTFRVQVNSLPTIGASVTTPTVCSGVADTLMATGGVSYLWSSNAGSATTASVSVTTTVNATYTVTGTDNNGCMNTAMVTVNVMNCGTGVSSFTANRLAIYPNPSAGRFVVNVQGFVPQNIKVLNLLGAEVYSRSFNNDNVVDLSNQQSGVYFMVISANGQSVTKKIVKE